MTNFATSWITVGALLILSFSSSAFAVTFTPKELEKLKAGKTVKQPLPSSSNDGFYGGTGWAIIDAPTDVVWKALLDWDSYHMYYPRTYAVSEIQRQGQHSLVRMVLGYKLLRIIYHLNLVVDEQKKMITYALNEDRPHDIKFTKGYWRLFPEKNGRTLAAYVVAVQVPKGIIAFIGPSMEAKIERYVLGAPGNLKKWVEQKSRGKYRNVAVVSAF